MGKKGHVRCTLMRPKNNPVGGERSSGWKTSRRKMEKILDFLNQKEIGKEVGGAKGP